MNTGFILKLTGNKNLSYRLYFPKFFNGGADDKIVPGITIWDELLISKDGGVFNAPVNSPVDFTNGWYYIDLTASEMNADQIIIILNASDGDLATTDSTCLIFPDFDYGTGSGGGLEQSDLVDGLDILPRENPTIGDVLKGIYRYYVKNNRRQL